MKKLLMICLVAAAAFVATSPADAEGGCGPAYHRGYYGRCVVNDGVVVNSWGRVVVAAPGIRLSYVPETTWYGARIWRPYPGGWRGSWHPGRYPYGWHEGRYGHAYPTGWHGGWHAGWHR